MRIQVASSLGHRAFAALLFVSVAFTACAGKGARPETPAQEEKPNASIINATTIVARCPEKAQMNAKEAQRSIKKLVEPCSTVPGGHAHFMATLMPGGRIELASPAGNPADGVVPTCVLKHQLLHQVRLKSPCELDVQLDEQRVPVRPAKNDEAPSGK